MKKRDVLDHGHVMLLNLAGPVRRPEREFDADDVDPALTARISYGNMHSERGREKDLRLADYLVRNRHSTPIEMIEVWLEMKMPIFVARQFVRHRTVTINEISARYTTLPDEWYLPEKKLVTGKSPSNKQGRSDEEHAFSEAFIKMLDHTCSTSYSFYLEYLNAGIAPEICRMFLHVNHYTVWVWKQNLWNIMHMLSLREDKHAQYETRQYAHAIHELLKDELPELMHLYEKYKTKENTDVRA